MNRVLAFLLLILVSFATITPCCLYDECAAEQTAKQDNSTGKGEGMCSPFFACSTCSGFVFTSRSIQLVAFPAKRVKHFERIYTDRTQSFYTSFWQPPREVNSFPDLL